jgi:hypothetical protein
MMIEHLKVKQIRALQGAILKDLGKLNIICGRNNSGKSTLLEGITAKDLRIPGRTFTDATVDQLVHSISNLAGPGNSDLLKGDLRDKVGEIVAEQEIWYKTDGEAFRENLEQAHRQSAFADSYRLVGVSILAAFYKQFSDDCTAILVPPKRALQIGCSMDPGAGIQPDGQGILNILFLAKNQLANTDARKVYEQISRAFTFITDGYAFDIFLNQDKELSLSFSQRDRAWISAADCGLGLQDLLVLLFFANAPPYDLVAIEEPESHLHPDMQRRLLTHLRRTTDRQFFITTHSNVFLNSALIDRVFYTSFDQSIVVDDATSRAAILNDLGYEVTDNLTSDLIILVEGPSDVPVIQEFLAKLGLDATYVVKIWPLGGDIMDQLDVSVFAERYQIVAILDRDPGSDRIRRRFVANCEALGIPVHRLERYSLENYFTLRALRTVFGGQIPEGLETLETHESLEKQIRMNVKKSNRKIAEAMTLEDILGTDLMSFFDHVRILCERSRGRSAEATSTQTKEH